MRLTPVALAAALLLALTGCVPSGPHASPSTSASATPVFASDADALKAAQAAYAAYLKVSDQIANDGGKNPDRIRMLVTPEQLASERRGSQLFLDHGIHTVGVTTFSNSSLQQVTTTSGVVEVVFYACWDATGVRVLNSDGADVTPGSRVAKQTLEIDMVSVDSTNSLALSSYQPWSGSSSC